MMSMQSGDADEPHQQMTDGVPQQRTAELSGVGICIATSQLKLDALQHLLPVQLCQEWRDAVVPRHGKHKPSSRIQHQLHSIDQMRGDTGQRCVTIVQPLQNERRHH